tara:strand:- start:5409 stop:5702 length:294 start_codon:yes stop_codon:yes gene_type:complete
MKTLIYTIFSTLLIVPLSTFANETFSVEIEALTLVMEQYNNNSKEVENKRISKPNYMAFKQDECNAKVEVTEKNGLQMTKINSFEVNVCKKEIITNN